VSGVRVAQRVLLLTIAVMILVWESAWPQREAHLDRLVLPEGCASCHVGHGLSKTPMLPAVEEELCYRCHGDPSAARHQVASGAMSASARPQDIKSVFLKSSRHPVELGDIHDATEELPAMDRSLPRHAECLDCHHHHYSSYDRPFEGVKGVLASGMPTDQVRKEHEVCYKCHSAGADVPFESGDISYKLDSGNPSYHPVHSPGRNPNVPSLLPPHNRSSVITCSDCHGNDDPMGPKGPHGSRFAPILVANYATAIENYEDPFQYDLCYRCHRRESILGDESFAYHSLHLNGNSMEGIPGTSCATCHDAHGSDHFKNLIDFNPEAVSPDPVTGRLDYESGPSGTRCFLSCHGVDHNPLRED
jgi:predicted CXXCH cytochrome family protein